MKDTEGLVLVGSAISTRPEGAPDPFALAAEALKLTAPDLLAQGIIDRIVPEPLGGAHRNPQQAAMILKDSILGELKKLKKIKPEKLIAARIEKFSKMGDWDE